MLAEETPLRILMVLESPFPMTGGGGAESQVRTLGRELRRRGHRVSVLTPRFVDGPPRHVERAEGLPIGRIAYPAVRGIGSVVLWLRLVAFLWRKRRRYDAIHVHIAHYIGAVSCAMGRLLGLPTIVKFTGQWELESGLLAPDASVGARLFKPLLALASAYQAISWRIGSEVVARGLPQRLVVHLPNAVDMSRFEVVRAARVIGDPLRCVYVGRLQKHKGLDTLLQAWQRAFPQAGRARLQLVGTGADEAKLRVLGAELGIANQLQFLGHRRDIESVLGDADLAVLPSLIEGLSNALLEFMASGLAVVASRVSGSEDLIVDGRNGWLFEVGDVGGLAAALDAAARLVPADLAALGRQARVDVAQAAGLDRVIARLLQLYRGTAPATVDAATAVIGSH